MDDRIKVARAIFPYMTCIALAYCVTLALYPGLESEIISCNLKSWMPVLLMFCFNLFDVIVSDLLKAPNIGLKIYFNRAKCLRQSLTPGRDGNLF